MKKAFLKYSLLCIFAIGALSSTLAVPSVYAQAEQGANDCDATFLGFPAWYRGLAVGENCNEIKSPTEFGGIGNFIWAIALNLIELLLRLTGFAAVAYIIYGGYKYMISAGSPDGMVGAKKTIMNAAIGLVISIAAVAIVRSISIGVGLQ